MSVYVDDMKAPFGRMTMCHMLATDDEELHRMAEHIGVKRQWWQSPAMGKSSHYDICLAKRALAVKAGAIEITWRQAGAMNFQRKVTGVLGDPLTAEQWGVAYRAQRRGEVVPEVILPPDEPMGGAQLSLL